MGEPRTPAPVGDAAHDLLEAQAYLLGARSILDLGDDSKPLSDDHRLQADVLLRDLGEKLMGVWERLDAYATAQASRG